jgi:hypothetical protein
MSAGAAWLFNFRQIRYFDIKGEYTGLFSRALTSPDGKIRIPINESADEHSQIEEYLHRWMGTEAQIEPEPGGIYLVNVTGARFARGYGRTGGE